MKGFEFAPFHGEGGLLLQWRVSEQRITNISTERSEIIISEELDKNGIRRLLTNLHSAVTVLQSRIKCFLQKRISFYPQYTFAVQQSILQIITGARDVKIDSI